MQESGITLIALVVTIIVLIILAAVSLNLILGQNGIISRAQQASKETKLSAFKEQVEMDVQDVLTGLIVDRKTNVKPDDEEFKNKIHDDKGYNVTDNGDGTITLEKDGGTATVNPDWTVEVEGVPTNPGQNVETTPTPPPTPIGPGDTAEGDQEYTDINEDVAVIPDGFKISDKPGESTIEDGLVVIGPDNSEFVWVPVSTPVLDVQGKTDAQINTAIAAEVAVGKYPMAIKVNSADYKGVLYDFSDPTSLTIIARTYTTNATSGAREPEYLTDSTSGDAKPSNNTIGITQESLQIEYNQMIASVIDNGGFYIGRYETSKIDATTTEQGSSAQVQSKKGLIPMNNWTSWYNMYSYQKAYITDNSIAGATSGMIWGSEWDQVMIWMKDVVNPYASNNPYILDSSRNGKLFSSRRVRYMDINNRTCSYRVCLSKEYF